jgi:D-alanyl-D-alanine dipeptidase
MSREKLLASAVLSVGLAWLGGCAARQAEPEVFRIEPLRSIEQLRDEALMDAPPEEEGEKLESDLVELVTLDPTIRLDIRYATADNFLSTPLYTQARAFLQRPAAEALVAAHRELREQGYGLLVHDAYRPWHVTKIFWEATPEDKRGFVADPAKGSRHNRGCAVDVTLYRLSSGRAVTMPSLYDEMTERSAADWPGGTAAERKRRELLRTTLERHGFTVYPDEWWHFDFTGWERYPLIDFPFEALPGSGPLVEYRRLDCRLCSLAA